MPNFTTIIKLVFPVNQNHYIINFGQYKWQSQTGWSSNNVSQTHLFDRGYTGYEHLDAFSLINMNGRVYDPWLGRMLSPDPIVQEPGNSQNYNSYSYVLNNPLKYTDPSGYRGAFHDWSNADAYFNSTRMTYNWKAGGYEDMYGNTVSFESADWWDTCLKLALALALALALELALASLLFTKELLRK